MSINSDLESLYRHYWDGLISNGSTLTSPKPTNPMLIKIDEAEYANSTIRIVICGQETWGWDQFGISIEDGMQGYWKFFVMEEFYDGVGRSAFWKAFRWFKREIKHSFSDYNCYFIYQNISKIARNDGATGVTPEIRLLERQYFPVFKREVEILSPNILIFLTGPNRDDDIRFHFSDATFNCVDIDNNNRRLAHVKSKQLPDCTYRVYHPSYYRGFTAILRNDVMRLIQNWGEQGVPGYRRQSAPQPEP